MKARTAWLAGAAGASIAAYRKFRPHPAPATAPDDDPRAEELRRKLEESRSVAEEHHEADVESRRAAVHDRARAAADEMRGE